MSGTLAKPIELNDQQQEIYELLGDCFDQERKRVAQLLADKEDANLLGETEFKLRDRVHALGARALEVAADERQKKGRIRAS